MEGKKQRRAGTTEATIRDVNEVPGHESPDVETVIEARPRYVIVEKLDLAGEVAEQHDPRA